MTRSLSSNVSALAATLVAVVILVIITAVGVGRAAGTSDPAPSAPPVVTPSPSPSDDPTPAPSDPAPGVFRVKLDVADPHDVAAIVSDESGRVTGARSGRAGDGMSVRWFDVKVENADADTLRVTWVGLAYDTEIQVGVFRSDAGWRLQLIQPAPPENSDATGFDRVLVLDFSEAVNAADVQAIIQDGVDSVG